METLYLHSMDSPLGTLWIGATREGICKLGIGNQQATVQWLLDHVDAVEAKVQDYQLIHQAKVQLRQYFRGKRKKFDLPLDMRGTNFQLQIWRELKKIPFSQTVTYQQLADNIKNPKAVRAVGGACGANPLPIIVPCHRVVGGTGLGGYSGGLNNKIKLLQHENVILI